MLNLGNQRCYSKISIGFGLFKKKAQIFTSLVYWEKQNSLSPKRGKYNDSLINN